MHVSTDLVPKRPSRSWTPTAVPARMKDELREPSLDRLIAAVATEGDRAAFSTLFSHLGPRVKAYLQRGGVGAAQAEDLTQEVFLAVWRKAAQFDPGRAGAAAWIFTIARNLKIDALRRGRLAAPGEDPSDQQSVPLADQMVAAEESARSLRGAIATLPEEQISILRLAFFEDLSHGEIVQKLGLPLGTIKSRLRLALTKLRRALGDPS